jgi:Ulp1 family protease
MNNSNSSSNPPSSRVTLKLKTPARKSPDESKAPPNPQPQRKSNAKSDAKPGAHWSDEYKRRMQADMDELTRK